MKNSRVVDVGFASTENWAGRSSMEELRISVKRTAYKRCKKRIKSLKKDRVCSGSIFSIAGEDEDELFNESDL